MPTKDQAFAESSLMSHERKRLRRFYEPLCLLYTLSQVRGDRTLPSEVSHPGLGLAGPKCYRKVVDAIAYICAYRKESGCVTAVALEETPEDIVVLLAANGGIGDEVVKFMEDILQILEWVIKNHTVQLNTTAGQKLLQILLDRVLPFNAPKIFQYYQQVNKMVPLVINQPVTGSREQDIAKLRNWFSANLLKDGIPLQECDMPMLARSSYRDRDIFEALHINPTNVDQSRNFEQLFKLLYKLGKHVAQCKHLVSATTGLYSELARGFRIETIDGSLEQKIPLGARSCSVQNISHRIFSETAKQELFLNQLRDTYPEGELNRVLSKDLYKTKTRVHAELLVLDHFEQRRGRFLFEQDKYIGCSKPACFLCHLFISCHPGRYSHPASHQKIYPTWRLPDISIHEPNAASRFQNQQSVLTHMTKVVRLNLENDVSTSAGRRMNHPDSTAGGISTIVDIGSDFGLSAENHSLEESLRMLSLQPSAVDSNSKSLSITSSSSTDGAEVESDGDSEVGGVGF